MRSSRRWHGQCEYCLSGRLALCRSAMFARPTGAPARLEWQGRPVNQFVNLSAFAERMLVHEHALVKIDPEVALDRAALTGCAVITGIGAVLNTARMPAGSTVAVVGCGGIGLNAIQGAASGGSHRGGRRRLISQARARASHRRDRSDRRVPRGCSDRGAGHHW